MSSSLDPNHYDWRCFAAAMRDRRGDDTPRLAFCDMLDDNWPGDPLIEFVRGMVEYARLDGPPNALGCMGWEWTGNEQAYLHGKLRDLLRRSWLAWPFWKEVPPELQHQWRWVRGFPDVVVCEWEWWKKWWTTLTAIGPVGDVFFTTLPDLAIEHYDLTDTYGFWVNDQEVLREVGKQAYLVAGRRWRSMAGWGMNPLHNHVVEWTLRQVWPEDDRITGLTIDPALAMLRAPDEPWRIGAARSP